MKKLPQFLPLIVISAFLILTNIVFLWIVLSKKAVPRPKIPTRATEGPAYLTILAGRSPWQAGSGCSPFRALPNSVPLDRVALEMKTISTNLKAYGTIIETYTREGTDRFCKNGNSYPTWNDLTNLKNNYGWVFGTNGKTHRTKAQLSTEEAQRDESIGALTQLQSHGHDKAWALFAYPNADEVVRTDPIYNAMQTNIVSADFAYGREYVYTPDSSAKNRRSEIGPPWWQKTYNTFGGKCNNSSLSCYNLRVFGNDRRYTKPSDLINFVNVQSDEWASLQFHFFVEGRNGDQTRDNSWDCTSPDRNKHWTTSPELYCWNDFKYVLGTIPSNVQVVTPDVVATAWGRTPPFNVTPTPTPTATPSPTPTSTPTPTPTPTPEATALKEPMRGVIPRDGMAVEAYREVANGFVVNVRWSELQADPPDSPIIHPNPIDNTLAQIRAWNSTHDPDLSLKIRLFTTTTTPTFWSSNREVVGEPILVRNPATGRSGYIGRFWTSSYKQAYDSLQTKLAEEYDDEIEIKDVTISRCMLVFAEPFSRYQTSTLRSSGWNETVDRTCHREAIDAHRAWTTTRSSLALNPEGPWREMLDYCRLSLGQRCILENNSLRSTSQGASYENMYSLIQAKGPPIIFQTATSDKIGSWQTTLQKAIGYGANALELNSGYTSYDLNELRDFDLQLEANPIGD